MYKEDFYKHECGLYVADAPQWSQRQYGQNSLEKGDMIYCTMRKIIDEDDKSEWAYNALTICADLLLMEKRWPDSLNHELDAKNFIEAKITGRYRSQRNMTRDPYILFYACCVHLNRLQFIEEVRIPWHLYSRRTWVWRKVLIDDFRFQFLKYVKLELKAITSHKKEFTRQLVYYRTKAAVAMLTNKMLGPISPKYLYT